MSERILTADEERALRALRRLARIWPSTLTLMTNESSLVVVDSAEWRELGPGLMPESDIIEMLPEIPVDTWNP